MNTSTLEQQFLNEFSRIDKAELFKFYQTLSKKPLVLADTGIPTRTFQHWKTFDIIPSGHEETGKDKKREWVRLNLNDYLWLKTVNSLRNFGYPFDNIKKAKDRLFSTQLVDKASGVLKQKPELLKQLLESSAKGTATDEIKSMLKGLLENDAMFSQLQSMLSQQLSLTTLWNLLIFQAIKNKKDEFGLFFLEDGTCLPFQADAFYGKIGEIPKEATQLILRTPHLYISLTSQIIEFLTDEEKNEFAFDLAMITDSENDLLRKFRSNEYKKITISYDKGQNSKIIKTEKEKKVKKENISDFVENVLRNPYNKVSLTATKKGELIVNVEKTKKL